MKKYDPLEDRLLLKENKMSGGEKTDGGIIIPDTAHRQIKEGVVFSIGVGKYALETGVFMPTFLHRNDLVVYPSGDYPTITIDTDEGKEELLLMRESDVLIRIGQKE